MKNLIQKSWTLTLVLLIKAFVIFGDGENYNQTTTTTPVLPPDPVPFTVSIDLIELALPNGWHSGVMGSMGSKCLLIAGRTNGMHGFDNNPLVNNFPPSAQNTTLYVIDFKNMKVWQRSLTDPSSGLTQTQVDTLSVTSPQFYQSNNTVYITGGYGINSSSGQMETKSTLTAVDVPGLINWVIKNEKKDTAAKHIRQTSHPLLQVTGGYMAQPSLHMPTLLIFGQNFMGYYNDNSNGEYTQQVRSFRILDNGKSLSVVDTDNQPLQNPAYRRRDLNVLPIMRPGKHHPNEAYVALSGVFTEAGGIWTVPVMISANGDSVMADPDDDNTFKQGMNNYASASVELYSDKAEDMYMVILGGITFGFFENGEFETDSEIPFTNEVTTIKIDKHDMFSQYIMDNEYPTILSTFSNPGNVLLFGAGAATFTPHDLPLYRNKVIALDKIKEPTAVGYIIGGIQSTLPDTIDRSDSAASPYIFQVTLTPK